MFSVAGSTCSPAFVLATALPARQGPHPGLGSLVRRVAPLRPFAHGRARDLTGSLATHPKPLPCSKTPGRADAPSPVAVVPILPSGHPSRRPQLVHNLEADTGLQLALSTLHERRHRRPCKTRFRLAGCASTGRVSNPLGHFERFQVTFPFSFPGLFLSQGWSMPGPLADPPRCSPICPATRIGSPSPTAGSSPSTASASPLDGRITGPRARLATSS